MRYTKYFSGVVKNQGVPSLDSANFALFMNIIHLEGKLDALNSLKKYYEGTLEHNKFDIRIIGYEEQLNILTAKLQPNELLQKLVGDSYSS